MLNGAAFLRTCWSFRIVHFIRLIAYFVLKFVLWNILQVLPVCWISNVVVDIPCLQHSFLAFDLYVVHLPYFKVFKSFLTLPFSIQCVPIIYSMFMFHLNADIGSFLKISLKFSFICKIFQFFLMVSVVFGRNR